MQLHRGAERSMDNVAAGECEPLLDDMEAHVTASRCAPLQKQPTVQWTRSVAAAHGYTSILVLHSP